MGNITIAQNYDVKISKSGHRIPVVNGVHLHSMYNPIREAQTLIENNKRTLEENDKILVFGLGFGYHIDLMLEALKIHPAYQLVVIEPMPSLALEYKNLNNNEQLLIIAGCMAHELYTNQQFLNFLLQTPAIISHLASYNLHSRYFQEILDYQAPRQLADLRNDLQDSELKNYFAQHEDNLTLNTLAAKRQKKGIYNSMDYLLFALNTIAPVNSTQGETK